MEEYENLEDKLDKVLHTEQYQGDLESTVKHLKLIEISIQDSGAKRVLIEINNHIEKWTTIYGDKSIR